MNSEAKIDTIQEESEILAEILNLPNQEYIINVYIILYFQRVIKIDALRTRNSLFDEGNKEYLVLLLTFYCKRKGITYKQGLNEVLAPFVYFRNSNLTLSKIFNYFSIFVDKYLYNFYADEVEISFYSLKIFKFEHRNSLAFKYAFNFSIY